jgi:hypothetical protein
MKNHTRLAALLLALALCLCACGSSSGDSTTAYTPSSGTGMMNKVAATELYSADEDYEYAAAEEQTSAIASGTTADTVTDTERKIVYTGSMDLQTKEFDKALGDITALVKESGGYISSQETNGRSLTYSGGYYSRYASLTVRVPADKFDSLMNGVSGICNVTEQSVSTDDISDTYYDAEAHLSTLKLEEERLLDILSKAEKLDDVITLEQALSDVRYQIESLTAQLRRMDNSVTYSTLTLYLNEVVEYTEPTTEPVSFAEKLAEAAKRSGESIADFFENLILWIVEELPLVLLWAVLIIAVLWVLVRVLRFVFRRSDRAPASPERPHGKIRVPWHKKPDASAGEPSDTPANEGESVDTENNEK